MAGIFQNGVWSNGFDFYTTPNQIWDGANTNFTIANTFARFSGQGAQLSGGVITKFTNIGLTKGIIGFALRLNTGRPGGKAQLLQISDTTGAVATQFNLAVNPDGTLQFWQGSTTGTLITSASTFALSAQVWYYMEVSFIVDLVSGFLEVRMDGNPSPIISFSGKTQFGTNTSWNEMQIRGDTGLAALWIDDVYILDTTGPAPYNTYLGDVKIVTVVPNKAGSYTQLTPFPSAPNWGNVDEIPPDDFTSYNFGATPGLVDTYGTTQVSGAGTVKFANVWARMAKDNSNVMQAQMLIISNGAAVLGPVITQQASFVYSNAALIYDPSTGVPFLIPALNSIQIGVMIAGPGIINLFITDSNAANWQDVGAHS